MVCHNLIGGIQYGGVEIYLELIRHSLASEYEILYYLPDHQVKDGKRYLVLGSALKVVDRIDFGGGFATKKDYILSCAQRERAFAGVLCKHRIDLVHFQHFIGHVPSLPYIAKALGVPTVYSMHDYYAVSHRFNLIDNTGRYEQTTFSSVRNADSCLAETEKIMPGSQARRLAFWGRMLATIDLIHTNSKTTEQALLGAYPHLGNMNIMMEGIPLDETQKTEGIAADPLQEGPLQVLVLGNFTNAKGAETLLRVFDHTREMDISFHVHGRIDIEYQEIIRRLDFRHVLFYSEYENKKLEAILKGKQVSLHLSIWPETYCITLSECWRARLVPVVSDIGALGERVQHGLNGFKAAVADVGAVVDILQRLSIDRELLTRMRGNITSDMYRSTNEHVQRLSHSYKKLIAQHPLPKTSKQYDNVAVDLRCCAVRLNSNDWAEIRDRPPRVATNHIAARAGIPRHPYYLAKFMLQQIRSRGIRVTAGKVFRTLKSRT
jgi:glycosyltransferase involved in cell wall biosynthesis